MNFRFSDQGAQLLRDVVGTVVKEFNNNPTHAEATAGGAWDQSAWLSFPATEVHNWPAQDQASIAAQPGLTCGSTGCVAGHLTIAAGYRPMLSTWERPNGDMIQVSDVLDPHDNMPLGVDAAALVVMAHPDYDLSEHADRFYGITDLLVDCAQGNGVAHLLFADYNNIADVVGIADRALVLDGRDPTGVPRPITVEPRCPCLA